MKTSNKNIRLPIGLNGIEHVSSKYVTLVVSIDHGCLCFLGFAINLHHPTTHTHTHKSGNKDMFHDTCTGYCWREWNFWSMSRWFCMDFAPLVLRSCVSILWYQDGNDVPSTLNSCDNMAFPLLLLIIKFVVWYSRDVVPKKMFQFCDQTLGRVLFCFSLGGLILSSQDTNGTAPSTIHKPQNDDC